MGNLCTKRELQLKHSNDQNRNNSVSPYHSSTSRAMQYGQIAQFQSREKMDLMDTPIRNKQNSQNKDPIQQIQQDLLQAREMNNSNVMLEHLENNEIPVSFINIGHPWAESPQTIGSIATMYLSILFMRELVPEDSQYFDQETWISRNIDIINQQYIFKKLQNNLEHKVKFLIQDKDRKQITILLIVFLVEFEQLRDQFLKCKIFERIIPLLQFKEENSFGQRIACGFILRELYKNNPKYVNMITQDELCIKSIKDFLKQQNQQHIIEGLNCIDDLCYDESYKNNISVPVCKFLLGLGIYEDLQNAEKTLRVQINEGHDKDVSFQDIKLLTIDLINCLLRKFNQFQENK